MEKHQFGKILHPNIKTGKLISDAESEEEFAFLTVQPSTLKNGKLRDHQLIGLNWLISLYELGINGILADEMGLGKTIQTIAFLAYLNEYKNIKGYHLIVCPNSVMGNWMKEFKKWLPNVRVVKLVPRKETRDETLAEVNKRNFDVCLTSYEGISICRKELSKVHWKYIIVDEAHRLKNDESVLSKHLRSFKTDLKLLMTGTPLQNNLRELWSLLNFILPELFNDAELFENYVNRDKELTQEEVEQKHIELITALHRILRPFLLKRTKEVLKQSLPPKKEVHVYLGLTPVQVKLYRNILLKKSISADTGTMKNVLMQLRKCCNHPYLFEGVEEEGLPPLGDHLITVSGKMIVLDKLLTKLYGGHQVLIFSQFTTMLDILEDYLIYKEYKYCRIDGETFIEDRERQLEEFVEPGSDKFVFLLSTRAGGLGINLASADTVVLYDSDWNPQVDLQAMDRAHRIGQRNPVKVYRLISESTIEEKIIERQRVKLKWDNLVILKGKMAQQLNKLNKNEMKDLLQFGANDIFKAEGGTFKDEDIDALLHRGEQKTAEMIGKVDSYMEKNGDKLFDLGIDSINIYEFEGANYAKKQKEDQAAMDKIFEETLEVMKVKKRMAKIDEEPLKRVCVPDFLFYEDKDHLETLLSKEANNEELTVEELDEKNRLLQTKIVNWNKADFQAFTKALEKVGRDPILVAEQITKTIEEVAKYMPVFFERVNEIAEGDRIIAAIEKAEKTRENKEFNQIIIESKCQNVKSFYDLRFETQFYNKIKSKLYTLNHDKYLIYQCYLHGCSNMKTIRANMLKEPLFRFDYYIKSLKEGALSKRVASIVKMLANESEYLKSARYKELKEDETKKLKDKREKERQRSMKARADKPEHEKPIKKVNIDNGNIVKRKQPRYLGPMNLVQADVITVEDEQNDGHSTNEPEAHNNGDVNDIYHQNGNDVNSENDKANGDSKKRQLNIIESFERVSSGKK